MLDNLTDQYFNEKSVEKRWAILKTIVFKCESFSKDFLRKHLKKSVNW